jgi:peptidoglycan/xylan/chitin deacetylase (PgdA/CDA1 family)
MAAGPSVVAKADLSLWGEPINQRAGFDKASRASVMVYVATIDDLRRMTDDAMLTAFGIKSVNRASVDKWVNKELDLALANYRAAAADCGKSDKPGSDWTCLDATPSNASGLVTAVASWSARVPPAQGAWRANLAAFARAYVSEQMRLAALFPKTTSEIDRFNDGEWNGDNLPDAQFLLTFDDGPNAPGGSTDDTLRMLASTRHNGVFFMLGGNLQSRAGRAGAPPLAEAFRGQCVASHGWEHQSHQRWDAWQDSIKRTHALLRSTFPEATVLPWFRPPYGQRTADSGAFFREQNLQVALWNIDSQDWNAHMSSTDLVDRMVTLMLVKRHGVLLFHDVHPKAHAALPVIFDKLGDAVTWRDCRGAMK